MNQETMIKTEDNKKRRNMGGFRSKGIIMVYFLVVLEIVFCVSVLELHILPYKYILFGVLILFTVSVLLFSLQFIRRVRFFSSIMSCLLSILFLGGIILLSLSRNTLSKVVDSSTTTDTLCIYVLDSSSITNLEDIKDCEVGVLTDIGRENTNTVVDEINSLLGTDIHIEEYKGTVDLIKALLNGQVDSILLNDAYMALADEDVELVEAINNLRIVWSYDISRTLELSNNFRQYFDSVQEGMDKIGNSIHQEAKDEESIVNTPFIVYVSGNDSEGKLRSNGRSDINVIMVINPNTKRVLLINTPRDYYVNLAGLDKKDKLTHAGIYGVDESMRTLEQIYDVPIQYYFRVNFTGFMEIIDALGGITVNSDVDFTVAEWHYTVGENNLSGIEALAFARERYSFSDGDRQRVKNQQAVIEGIIEKVSSPAILTKYNEVLKAIEGTIETNMSMDEITSLVLMQLDDNASWDIDSVLVNGFDSHERCYSIQNISYVMLPDEESIEEAKTKIEEVVYNLNWGNVS